VISRIYYHFRHYFVNLFEKVKKSDYIWHMINFFLSNPLKEYDDES